MLCEALREQRLTGTRKVMATIAMRGLRLPQGIRSAGVLRDSLGEDASFETR